jgi:hypothetical protein
VVRIEYFIKQTWPQCWLNQPQLRRLSWPPRAIARSIDASEH